MSITNTPSGASESERLPNPHWHALPCEHGPRCPYVNCRPSLTDVVICPDQHPLPVREPLRPKPGSKLLSHSCLLHDSRPWLTTSGKIVPEMTTSMTAAEAHAVGWTGEA